MIRRPPRSTRTDTLFPYTTLFRSYVVVAVVRHRHGLGVALGLVVDAPGPDRVHVAPVRLRLRVHQRVAVHLARGGQEELRALGLGQAQDRKSVVEGKSGSGSVDLGVRLMIKKKKVVNVENSNHKEQ